MSGAAIMGLGTAVPERSIGQGDALAVAQAMGGDAEHAKLLAVLYRRSNVGRRGSVLLDDPTGGAPARQRFFPPARHSDDRGPTTQARLARFEEEAAPLALRSARAALDESGVRASSLTHLITVSCTGFAAPGVDASVIRALGLSPAVARTNIGFMGCHGAINGLRVASAFVSQDPGARVLLTAVELCSLHFQYGTDPQRAVANALFADGAASAVLGTPATSDAGADPWRVAATGSCLIPDSHEAMTWRIRDHGFEMTLSSRVPALIESNLGGWLHEWLSRHGLGVGDIGSWAIHPGGPRVISTVASAAGIGDDATAPSRAVLSDYGNMSSPTVLFIVDRLRRAGAARPCVALAFGPGLVVESALFH